MKELRVVVRASAVLLAGAVALAIQLAGPPPVLPASASAQLIRSLDDSEPHAHSIWRDTPPINADGTVTGYIEIARGDRRKWEFSMRQNARAIDRVMPESVGGYPVNYGFVPQTISYDGDPFDILVLGPPIEGGTIVRGTIAGIMHMEDEKGLDSKVVVSRVGGDGRPTHALTNADETRIGDFFKNLQEARTRQVFEGAGLGLTRPGAGLGPDDARLFHRVPQSARRGVPALPLSSPRTSTLPPAS